MEIYWKVGFKMGKFTKKTKVVLID